MSQVGLRLQLLIFHQTVALSVGWLPNLVQCKLWTVLAIIMVIRLQATNMHAGSSRCID
jgi:hypothetical protein